MTNSTADASASLASTTTQTSTENSGTRVPTSRRARLAFFGILSLVAIGGMAFYAVSAVRHGSATESVDSRNFLTTEIAGNPFRAALQTKGTIDSARNVTLQSEVRGFTQILTLLPQGTQVGEPVRARTSGVVDEIRFPTADEIVVVVTDKKGKKHAHRAARSKEWTEVVVSKGDRIIGGQILVGDVVCELDASKLIEAEKQEQIYVTNTQATFEMARKNIDIRAAKNESLIAAAKLRAELTELDLKKYLSGTYPQQQEKLEGQIQQNQEDLTRAQDVFNYAERLQSKGYKSREDVETARLKVLQSEFKLNDTESSLKVLETFAHDRTLLQLTEGAADAKRDLHRVKLSCEAAMAQLTSISLSRERIYEIYRGRLQRARQQIKACQLVAPHAGQVVHAQVRSNNRTASVVEEGMEVRERQDIVHLPDLSSMKVDVDIHESVISRIRAGQEAEIWIDALPGVTYRGRLTDVSTVPLPGQFPHVDRRLFAAEVTIETKDESLQRLRPGMTARVELIVARSFEKLPQIPQAAVISAGKRHFAWVLGQNGPERRPLSLGISNDQAFVIEGGLNLGEQVVLYPRDYFNDEIDELELTADDSDEVLASVPSANSLIVQSTPEVTESQPVSAPVGKHEIASAGTTTVGE